MENGSACQYRRIRAAPVVVGLLLLLTGCITETPPPALSVSAASVSVTAHLIYVNVTVTNDLDEQLNESSVHVVLTEWLATPEKADERPGDQLAPGYFARTNVQISAFREQPKREVYYDRAAAESFRKANASGVHDNPLYFGPKSLQPGESESLSFAFGVKEALQEPQGYYIVRVHTVSVANNDGSSGTHYIGCFNADVSPFYGIRDGGLACPNRNEAGSPTFSDPTR